MSKISSEEYDKRISEAQNKLNELKSRQTASATVNSLIDLISAMQRRQEKNPGDLVAMTILKELENNTVCKEIMPDLNLKSFDAGSAVNSLSSTASSAKLEQLFGFLFEGEFLNVKQESLLAPIKLWRQKYPSLWIKGRLYGDLITTGTGTTPSLLAAYHDSILKQCVTYYQKKFNLNANETKPTTHDKINANSAVLVILQHLAYIQTTLQSPDTTLVKKLALLHAVRLIVTDTFKKPIENTSNFDVRLSLFTELFDQVSALMLIEPSFNLFQSSQQNNGSTELQNSLIVYLEGMLNSSSLNKRTSVLSKLPPSYDKRMTYAKSEVSITSRAANILMKSPAPVTKLPYLIYSMEAEGAKPDTDTLEEFAIDNWSRASESDTTYRLLTQCFSSIKGNLQQFFSQYITQDSSDEFRLLILTSMYNTLIPVLNHIHRAALVLDCIDAMKDSTSITTERNRYVGLWNTLNKYTVAHIESLPQHAQNLLTNLEQESDEDISSSWDLQKECKPDYDTSHIEVISSFLTDITGSRREAVIGHLQRMYTQKDVKIATCISISNSISATTASDDKLKESFDDTLKTYIESGDPEVLRTSEFNPVTQLNTRTLKERATVRGFLNFNHTLSKAVKELDNLPANHLTELSHSRTRQDYLPAINNSRDASRGDLEPTDTDSDAHVSTNGYTLHYASDSLKDDKDVVIAAVTQPDNTPCSATNCTTELTPESTTSLEKNPQGDLNSKISSPILTTEETNDGTDQQYASRPPLPPGFLVGIQQPASLKKIDEVETNPLTAPLNDHTVRSQFLLGIQAGMTLKNTTQKNAEFDSHKVRPDSFRGLLAAHLGNMRGKIMDEGDPDATSGSDDENNDNEWLLPSTSYNGFK